MGPTETTDVDAGPDGAIDASPDGAIDATDAPWWTAVRFGVVVEAWRSGELRFGVVKEVYGTGAVVSFIEMTESGTSAMAADAKVSFGELVSVWPRHLCPDKEAMDGEVNLISTELCKDVDAGVQLIKGSRPRSLNLVKIYDAMQRLPKANAKSQRTSFQLAPKMFPMLMRGSRQRRAAATVATGILLAADSIRFRRGTEGRGWRSLPPSVTVSRARCSFVDACRKLLDSSTPVRDRRAPWSREHTEILRELEICAASGALASGTPASALDALGYSTTDDGAASLLLDIGYWGTGTAERDGGGDVQMVRARTGENKSTGTEASFSVSEDGGAHTYRSNPGAYMQSVLSTHNSDSSRAESEDTQKPKSAQGRDSDSSTKKVPDSEQILREWTFPPSILAEARELRSQARSLRMSYSRESDGQPGAPRRWFNSASSNQHTRIYCIDDRNARFLDDAVSIEILDPRRLVRVCVHIADVDAVVRSGSVIDELARERGQSLYLPLKPLHMLPAAAMDAASFSTNLPADALTAQMDLDITTGEIVAWEVFASVVSPVIRINYAQFDALLDGRPEDCELSDSIITDLTRIAAVSPMLAEKLDMRRNGKKNRRGGIRVNGDSSHPVVSGVDDDTGIASVRLVKRRESTKGGGAVKVAQVVDFRTTGAHAVVADLLISVSSLFRQFAHRHGAFLPEERGAASYVSRCGTAPMRRYADLAVQRQVKCVLFGRQPAGRRRMGELRAWLAKKHAASEKTVAIRRRAVLYESLADHCAQQREASKLEYAVLRASVRSISRSRRKGLRAEVGIDGTGLYATANIPDTVANNSAPRNFASLDVDEREQTCGIATGDRVELHVLLVDPSSQRIEATVARRLDE